MTHLPLFDRTTPVTEADWRQLEIEVERRAADYEEYSRLLRDAEVALREAIAAVHLAVHRDTRNSEAGMPSSRARTSAFAADGTLIPRKMRDR
jgi:Tfp pilus assembly protein PilX